LLISWALKFLFWNFTSWWSGPATLIYYGVKWSRWPKISKSLQPLQRQPKWAGTALLGSRAVLVCLFPHLVASLLSFGVFVFRFLIRWSGPATLIYYGVKWSRWPKISKSLKPLQRQPKWAGNALLGSRAVLVSLVPHLIAYLLSFEVFILKFYKLMKWSGYAYLLWSQVVQMTKNFKKSPASSTTA
jgi:hypothetical protein